MKKDNTVFLNRKKASKGDIILFERNNRMYEGKVFLVRTKSVLVEITVEAAKTLGYEQPNTVVGHGKYCILANEEYPIHTIVEGSVAF